MFHKPINLKELSLTFPHKICFKNFNTQIYYGNRIAIIGRNGSGKSSLLRSLQGNCSIISGTVFIPTDVIFGYVPQIVESFTTLSGGERFNKALTNALSIEPNILLLDEPTNHLDRHNRKQLMQMLARFQGTLIIVSHDLELLNNNINTLWHIDNEKIRIFTGAYQDYIKEITNKRATIEQKLVKLAQEKTAMHQALMQEQQRIAKSRANGKKKIATNRWTKLIGGLKTMQAEKSQGNKLGTCTK